MLLFINQFTRYNTTIYHFKTSYVTVNVTCCNMLPLFQNIVCYCLSEFSGSRAYLVDLFQNIVCYCLSLLCLFDNRVLMRFQNIVCYCLSLFPFSLLCRYKPFQNIVCYCLSPLIKDLRYKVSNFKTSYVTVYHMRSATLSHPTKFQNIVCYCLSMLDRQIRSLIE